jgi:TPR repeat protein
MAASEKQPVASGIFATLLVPQRTPSTVKAVQLPAASTDNPGEFAPPAVTAQSAATSAVGVQSADLASLVVAPPPEAPPAPSTPVTPPAVIVSTVEPPPEAVGSMQADLGARRVKPPAGLPPATLSALLTRGDDCLRTADIVSARLFCERAADAGAAGAALRLAETYDPAFLEHAQLRGIAGDMAKAVLWYRRARDLGSDDAKRLLEQLDTE